MGKHRAYSVANVFSIVVSEHGNVTKVRLGPCQGSNARKVTGAGLGSGCGVQRRRRRLAMRVCQSEYSADLDLKH